MTPTERTITLDSMEISFIDTGTDTDTGDRGLCVLMLHGNSSCKEVFNFLGNRQISKAHRLIAIDLPGHGKSSDAVDPETTYSIPGYADFVHRFITELGVHEVAIVGWSLGGHIGIDMMNRFPEVRGVMAIGSPPAGLGEFAAAFPGTRFGHLAAQEHWTEEDIKEYVAEKYGLFATSDPTILSAARRADGRARACVFNAFFNGIGTSQKWIVENTTVPLAVVCGERDSGIDIGYLNTIAYSTLWEGHVHVIPTAGHACFIDNPDHFNHILENFLSAIGIARPSYSAALDSVERNDNYNLETRTIILHGTSVDVTLLRSEWDALIYICERRGLSFGDALRNIKGTSSDDLSALVMRWCMTKLSSPRRIGCRTTEVEVNYDWNDIRLFLAVRRLGSFSAAAAAIGVDQATVSRKISRLEDMAGTPLFRRSGSGAVATEIGEYLIEKAATVEVRATSFYNALRDVNLVRQHTVIIQASEGVSSYLLSPLLSGHNIGPLGQVIATRKEVTNFPPARIISDRSSDRADIRIVWAPPRKGPVVGSGDHVRKIASIRFSPFFSRKFRRAPRIHPQKFEHLTQVKILTLSSYALFDDDDCLGPWNAIVDSCQEPCFTVDFTSSLERPLVHGSGIALLPTYSSLYSSEIFQYEFNIPPMLVDLWLCAGEDDLRTPAVRKTYDLLGLAFSSFDWSR